VQHRLGRIAGPVERRRSGIGLGLARGLAARAAERAGARAGHGPLPSAAADGRLGREGGGDRAQPRVHVAHVLRAGAVAPGAVLTPTLLNTRAALACALRPCADAVP